MQDISTTITARVGPQQYIMRQGVLNELPILLNKENIHKIMIVHGTISWQKAKKYLTSLFDSNINVHEHLHSGECSEAAIDELAQKLKAFEIDAVVAVGGGKIMDTVKYAAYRADHLPFIAIPTIASNCAPWTPVSVLYDETGVFQRLDVLPQQAAYLLIEPQLIFDAPREYFIAGMGDTLAKWYESDAILAQAALQARPMLKMARMTAAECKRTILENGAQALVDLDQGVLTDEFLAVAEVIIGVSGLVGGFGDTLARTTIAHEIHDALTIHPEAHQFLHGHLVAYGILVQLAVEEQWEEIATLSSFYRPLGIPTSLREIGLSHLDEKQIKLIAMQASRSGLPVHQLPYLVDANVLVQAIQAVEKLNSP